ncbi:response regulator transcription factor [Polluticoccus soli]|uniref:response regulator transcription factor n=1 Tax=Polluticoccus soli TaxID=3034150 RepID=UPI0023E2C382|nr:response regulator transcription factor [Flavipsychrobacter sp. JY13-12]
MSEDEKQTIHLALADDHALFRKGLSELVTGFEGMHILFDAANGSELIEKLRSAKKLPDICILDINMPVMNGYETAEKIKAEWPNMKILALSMLDTEFNIIKMLKAGAGGYILKDAEPKELQKALLAIYSDGFYHSELVTSRLRVKEGPLSLTDKEETFLGYCCTELTYRDIAERMNVSPRTVDGYRDILFAKLDVKSRTGLAMYAIKSGLVTLT